jgi:hypothetical protein
MESNAFILIDGKTNAASYWEPGVRHGPNQSCSDHGCYTASAQCLYAMVLSAAEPHRR